MSDMMIGPDELGPLPAPDEGDDGQVLCRVCDAMIDTQTGDPVEEVGPENVAAVREYTLESGAAEEGGIPLVEDDGPL